MLIDEVKVTRKGKEGRGIKKLIGDEYFFEGHFPGRPIMPGVLIMESMAQTAMAVIGRGDIKLSGVDKVKFRQTIEPDDILKIDVTLKEEKDGIFKVEGKVEIDKNIAAAGLLTLSGE